MEYNEKELTPKMTLEELQETYEYLDLTTRMRKFLDVYLVTKDKHGAAMVAYDCKDVRRSRIMASICMRNPRIQDCVARFYGKESKETFLHNLRNIIRHGNPSKEKVKLIELYANCQGYAMDYKKIAEEEKTKRVKMKERRERYKAKVLEKKLAKAKEQVPTSYEGLSEYESGHSGN